MASPSARLLELLELLQSRPLVTGGEIADRLGIDRRTVRRYVTALEALGVPVEGQRGVGGGYRIRPGYRLPPLTLDDDEAAAVALGLALAEQRGLAGAEAALTKLTRVLPQRLATRASRLVEQATLTTPSGAVPADSATLYAIAEALRRGRSLELDYTRSDGDRRRRTLDPLGLVERNGRWYVPARDHARGDVRTFRADRIANPTIGGPAEPPPAGFDPERHVVEMLVRLPWQWRIRVTLHAPIEEIAPRLPATVAELSPTPTGTELTMRAQSLTWAASVIAGLDTDFHVIEPGELRAELRRLAARLRAAATSSEAR
ncbi:MAG: YafY family protein [Gaiellales bacterium]